VRRAVLLLCLLACEHDPGNAPPPPACIVDSLPPLLLQREERPECTAENLDCHQQCLAGDADACFSRAISIEQSPAGEQEALELFRRACMLGMANACTNWGATTWALDDRVAEHGCLYRVFEKTCEVGDPFGCGMAARFLVNDRVGLIALAHGRFGLELSCLRLGGFPCRIIALYIERGTFAADETARIPELMARACDGGDDNACGVHATVEETFHD
jgi:hypothetical protein